MEQRTVEDAMILDLVVRLRDLTIAQLEAVRAKEWEQAATYLRERSAVLTRLQTLDTHSLARETREAIAALLEEVQALDQELVATVERAMAAIRQEQQALERNDAAARSYRRALGTANEPSLLDEEA